MGSQQLVQIFRMNHDYSLKEQNECHFIKRLGISRNNKDFYHDFVNWLKIFYSSVSKVLRSRIET